MVIVVGGGYNPVVVVVVVVPQPLRFKFTTRHCFFVLYKPLNTHNLVHIVWCWHEFVYTLCLTL